MDDDGGWFMLIVVDDEVVNILEFFGWSIIAFKSRRTNHAHVERVVDSARE